MQDNTDLKILERKAFRSAFQDGLLDLLLGLIFFSSGISGLLPRIGISRHWITPVVLALPVLFVYAKRHITIPRMGLVKFGPSRKAYRKKILIIMIAFQIVTWIIYMLAVSSRLPGQDLTGLSLYFKRLSIGMMLFLLPFSFLAYFLDIPRLYLLALMTSVGESLYDYLLVPWNGLLTMGISGITFILIGSFLLFRFVRKYPRAEED
jgi:hypothetical protein